MENNKTDETLEELGETEEQTANTPADKVQKPDIIASNSNPNNPEPKKSPLLMILIIVLILVAAGAGAWWYMTQKQTPATNEETFSEPDVTTTAEGTDDIPPLPSETPTAVTQ